MTDRISSDASRSVCRRPEDDRTEEPSRDEPAPTCRDRLTSHQEVDWDKVPTSCDANAADAVRNAKAPPPAGASTNAARTGERDVRDGPYAAAGRTHDGGSVFVGVAAVKGRTAEGIEREEHSASIQVGKQNEVQGTVARVGYSGAAGSVSVEGLTANAHAGVENSDGSRGVNVGAGATLVGGEVTLKHSGWSITGGLAMSAGAEAHAGIRDDDKDGRPETCFRIALGAGIGGLCVESPVVIRP